MGRNSKNHLNVSLVVVALLAVVGAFSGCLGDPAALEGAGEDIGVEHQALVECPDGHTPDPEVHRGTCLYGLRSVDALFNSARKLNEDSASYVCRAYCRAEFVLRSEQPTCEPPSMNPSNIESVCEESFTEDGVEVVFNSVETPYEDRAERMCRRVLGEDQARVDALCVEHINRAMAEIGNPGRGLYETEEHYNCCIPLRDDRETPDSSDVPDKESRSDHESW